MTHNSIMENTESSTTPQLPPGFRFHPTDEELVVHYLKKKASSVPLPVTIIAEIDLYKFDPWELPGKATFGEQEWYFFSPRDRKYPNGARPNRAATSGYWKATGTDKPILTGGGTQKVGVKKALVFYGGKPPKGIKTNWIMHEYRLIENTTGNNNNNKPPCAAVASNKKGSLRLDDWVLCRIYKKNNSHRPMEREKEDSMDDLFASLRHSTTSSTTTTTTATTVEAQQQNPSTLPSHHKSTMTFGALLANNDGNLLEDILTEGGINNSSTLQLASSSTISGLPLKRTLPPPYWNDVEAIPTKRFHTNTTNSSSGAATGTSTDGSSQIATLLNQLPHAASFHQHSLLGSLADGVFRHPYPLSGTNWNS